MNTSDHRRSRTQELLAAIAAGDPLALAEAYHRTSAAAHAVATRLVRRDEVEGLLRAAYLALWREPPVQAPLEAWVRHRVFVEGRSWLSDHERPAASPSTTLLLRSSPPPGTPTDPTERAIAGLDDDALRALLLAHDRGIPTADQRADEAPVALRRALYALAGQPDPGGCDEHRLGDWILGLLDDDDADRVALTASAGDCAQVTRALRAGRRRLEGLPPAPDVGHRVIAYVLGAAPGGAVAARPTAPVTGATTSEEHPESGEGQDLEVEPADDALTALRADAASPEPAPAPPAEDVGVPPVDDVGVPPVEDVGVPPGDGVGVPPGDDHGPTSALTGAVADALPDEGLAAPSALDSEPAEDTTRSDEGAAAERPATAPLPTPERSSWSTPSASEDRMRLEGEGFDDDQGGGRRAVTVILTILGGLLLLAAGAVAGLLVIRIFLG